jgi:hypothetical protein
MVEVESGTYTWLRGRLVRHFRWVELPPRGQDAEG